METIQKTLDQMTQDLEAIAKKILQNNNPNKQDFLDINAFDSVLCALKNVAKEFESQGITLQVPQIKDKSGKNQRALEIAYQMRIYLKAFEMLSFVNILDKDFPSRVGKILTPAQNLLKTIKEQK